MSTLILPIYISIAMKTERKKQNKQTHSQTVTETKNLFLVLLHEFHNKQRKDDSNLKNRTSSFYLVAILC